MKIDETLMVGITGSILLIGAYELGKKFGYSEGVKAEKQAIVETMDMRRYDVLQNAKFAGTAQRQDNILKEAEYLTYAINFVDHNYEANKKQQRAKEDSLFRRMRR